MKTGTIQTEFGTFLSGLNSISALFTLPPGFQEYDLNDVYPTLVDYSGINSPAHQLDGKSMVPLLKNVNAEWNCPSFTSYEIEYYSVRDERYRYIRYPALIQFILI
jgi:hypothetical protein